MPVWSDPGRPSKRSISIVGNEGGDAGQARQGEGACGGKGELSVDGGLGVRARRVGRGAVAGHDQGEPVGGRRCTSRFGEVGRHGQHLRHVLARHRDLGKAHGGSLGRRRLVVAGLVNGDADGVKGRGREGHDLSGGRSRARSQVNGGGMASVEGQGDFGDPARSVARLGLDQRHLIGGDGIGEVGLPPLTTGIGNEGAGFPGRVEIAVDGGVGALFGCERDRVAVARSRDVDGTDVVGRGVGINTGLREQVDRTVARVGLFGVLVGLFGVPRVGRERVPTKGLFAIGISHDQGRPLGHQFLHSGRLCRHRAGVVDGTVGVQQTRSRHVFEPSGVSRRNDRTGIRFASGDGAGLVDGVGDDGRRHGWIGHCA